MSEKGGNKRDASLQQGPLKQQQQQQQQQALTQEWRPQMNWQGRYRPIDDSRLRATKRKQRSDEGEDSSHSPTTDGSASAAAADATAVFEDACSGFGSIDGRGGDCGLSEPSSAQLLVAKKMAEKWRAVIKDKKKGLTPVEEFAKTAQQRQAVVSCKESMSIQLPMPIIFQVREEALAVLQSVAKVYQKKFGSTHKLTVDARTRIAKIKTELGLM